MKWIPLKQISKGVSNCFTLCTYNILARDFCNSRFFYNSCEEYLDWNFRRRLLEKEFTNELRSDIICIQEMQESLYREWLFPLLSKMEYDGIMLRKEREQRNGSFSSCSQIPDDGCAIFFNKNKFSCVNQENIDFTAYARENIKMFDSDAQLLINRPVHNVGLCVRLNDLRNGKYIWIATTHIYWNWKEPDVQLYQVKTLLQHLRKCAKDDEPVIICGDFNSDKDTAVYEYMRNGKVYLTLPSVRDSAIFSKQLAENALELFCNPFGAELEDAYNSETFDIPYTYHVGHWCGVIDHIFYSAKKLEITQIFNPLAPNEEIRQNKAQPNEQHPSDHLPLMVEFQWL
jgi:CCR4-NOT transcription complex subunit 6